MNMQNPRTHQSRRRQLVAPRLQLKLGLSFAGLVTLALALQFVFMVRSISQIAMDLPGESAYHFDRFSTAALGVLGITALVVVPLTVLLGILATFRIVGPLQRIERYLRDVRDGGRPADLELREGDAMEVLAQLLNEITAPMRREQEVQGTDDRRAA
jgi:nitrogen fixation/metabolism regulation signal transduction histidine kinase